MRWHTSAIAALWMGTIGTMGRGVVVVAADLEPADCRAIADAAQRLVCYDRATAPANPVAPEVPVPPAPIVAPSVTVRPSAPTMPAAIVAPAPTPVQAAPSSTPADQFGLDQRQLIASGRMEKSPALALQSISARITHVGFRANGEFVVTLDNGQIWEQTEVDALAQVRAGDIIQIDRGLLGSYLLVASNHERTRIHRVH